MKSPSDQDQRNALVIKRILGRLTRTKPQIFTHEELLSLLDILDGKTEVK